MANRGIRIPAETLLALRTRLAGLPPRSAARREEIGRIAGLFGVSSSTVYRALKSLHQPDADQSIITQDAALHPRAGSNPF